MAKKHTLGLMTANTLFTGLSVAGLVNNRFTKPTAYVTLQARLNQPLTIAGDAGKTNNQSYAQAQQIFQMKNSHIVAFKDMQLCDADYTTLDKIYIDTTFQRELNFHHVINIISNFDEFMVMPICVYQDPQMVNQLGSDTVVCWDGQHTAVALAMIAGFLGEQLSNCRVPIVKSRNTQKYAMRNSFITLNGKGKIPLSEFDMFEQKVYAVRQQPAPPQHWINNNKQTWDDWNEANKKQQYLAAAGVFLTEEGRPNDNDAGAMTRLNEILNLGKKYYSLDVTKNFCEYCSTLGAVAARTVATKEVNIIYEYFRLCEDQGITIDSQYIKDFVASIKIHKGDFNAEVLVKAGKKAHREYWDKTSPALPYKADNYAIFMHTFIEQVKHRKFPHPVPKLPKEFQFNIAAGILL